MSFGTIIQQGRFTSTGASRTLQIRSDLDWMWVYNETILNDVDLAADRGAKFYWQRGMAAGRGLEYRKLGTVANDPITTLQLAANSGFTLVNSADDARLGAIVAATAVSGANPPVVTTASTAGFLTGDVVRVSTPAGFGAQQLGGIDFRITVIDGTTFALSYMSQIVAAATAFSFRKVNFDPIYYPRRRFITKISQAAQAIVTLSVDHGYTVGQAIRFNVKSAQGAAARYGMTEIDGLIGNIVAVGQADADGITNTITVDIDTTAFTAFAFPLTAETPFTPASITPVGEDTAIAIAQNVDILDDATLNTAYIGMILAGGNSSPAGANGDTIYWVAGKSFSVDNQ